MACLLTSQMCCLSGAVYAEPESLIVRDEVVVIHCEVCHKCSAAAGIAILPVCQAEIFLGKRLQCELRKTYPGRNKLAARFSDLEFQPLDGQGVGGRTPSQINV